MKNTLKFSAIYFIFSIGVLAQEIVDETLNTQVDANIPGVVAQKEIDNLGAGISKNKSATNDVNTKAQVNEKEIQLLKLQIQEIQIKSSNPLGG